jgi:ABC-type arginine transport system ATPase subunit
MPMVAEGLRKVATLIQLQRNGWLSRGSTLFWDEPEVNLNPVLMDNIVAAILELARTGVQVFLATHSYLILREIEVQATKSDKFRYFSLLKTDSGVEAHPADSYLEIRPNAIERHYAELYDRGIDKQLAMVDERHES